MDSYVRASEVRSPRFGPSRINDKHFFVDVTISLAKQDLHISGRSLECAGHQMRVSVRKSDG